LNGTSPRARETERDPQTHPWLTWIHIQKQLLSLSFKVTDRYTWLQL
jgi:hypothetical protein